MKIGIEIHQRLDCKKLFCRCDSNPVNNKSPDIILKRKLHPVLSELGETDLISKKEAEKQNEFLYQYFNSSNCLVEADEEPPNPINPNALKIACEISMQLECFFFDEIHTMRKIVIDGSNTSGFQRTAMVSFGGKLKTSRGIVRITSIALEEESAGIVEKSKGVSTYKLDRLGIPLVEITTEPHIVDEKHLKETAQLIGNILRATGKVARGIGTIRQDVNISIEKGERIEIKGAQDLSILNTLVQNENKRQLGLIQISNELKRRFKSEKISFDFEMFDLTFVFGNTSSKIISKGLSNNEGVFGIKLPNYSGILGIEIQNGKRYGTELSDYAKQSGVKGIIHSDEDLSKYQFSKEEIESINKKLKTGKNDAFVLVVSKKETAFLALRNVYERSLILGVLKETRKANPDGTTSYLRPISGGARMYPETDIPPIVLDTHFFDSVKKEMSVSFDEQKKYLESILNKEMAQIILKSKNLSLFEKFVSKGYEPMLVAITLENIITSVRRQGIDFLDLEDVLDAIFSGYKNEKIAKSAIEPILIEFAKGSTFAKILKEKKLGRIKGKKLEKISKELNYDIKEIMKKYRLNIEPDDVVKLIKNHKN
ncbi:MAG: Glu-tRNA(Gln) amidotransferase subunit GatE [Candidatus Micrarchaeia archaeon]